MDYCEIAFVFEYSKRYLYRFVILFRGVYFVQEDYTGGEKEYFTY